MTARLISQALSNPRRSIALLMASLSLDVTGLLMIGVNYRDSSYAPHQRAAEIILEEEEEHETFASGELREATDRFGADRGPELAAA